MRLPLYIRARSPRIHFFFADARARPRATRLILSGLYIFIVRAHSILISHIGLSPTRHCPRDLVFEPRARACLFQLGKLYVDILNGTVFPFGISKMKNREVKQRRRREREGGRGRRNKTRLLYRKTLPTAASGYLHLQSRIGARR